MINTHIAVVDLKHAAEPRRLSVDLWHRIHAKGYKLRSERVVFDQFDVVTLHGVLHVDDTEVAAQHARGEFH